LPKVDYPILQRSSRAQLLGQLNALAAFITDENGGQQEVNRFSR
jgi:hypothetical protein